MHTTSPPGWSPAELRKALTDLKGLGHTASELAELAKISRSQMSRWGSGSHRPGHDAVRNLAHALADLRPASRYRRLVRDLCDAAGYPALADDILGVGQPTPAPSTAEPLWEEAMGPTDLLHEGEKLRWRPYGGGWLYELTVEGVTFEAGLETGDPAEALPLLRRTLAVRIARLNAIMVDRIHT